MAISFPNHNLEDPFHHSSLLSLLRKTTGDRSTRAINSNQQEPQFLHQFLKPVAQAIRSSENFLEQAKMILDSNSVPRKPDLLIEALSQDEGMDLAVNAADHRQRRRPAMRGRKRCEFSLRSDLSQSSLNADTTSNILQLKDPEEFFLAFERSEKADRFLKKLRGEDATNVTQYRQPEKTRTRRPGISGKKYSYKHPVLPDIAEKCSSSQEEKLDIYGDFVSSQTEISSQEAPDAPGTSQEMAISDSEIRDITQRKDSVSMMENNVGKLLETLMFSCEDLDGGGTVSLLQEQLGVKPIDLPKLSLPNLSVLPSYFSPSQRLSSRPADEIPATALSAFRKLASNSNGKTPAKFQPEPESSSPQTSPTPPNMLASISRLLKHNTKMDMHDSPSLDLPQENKSFVKHSYSGQGTGISSIPSSVDISKHDTRSLNFSQYFTAASVDGISTSNGRSPIKFPKETANSICPPTSTPPRSLEALLPISQKHGAQFNNGSPGKHSPSVVQMGIHGISPPADANKDDTGSLGFSLDPSATNIDGRRLGFDGDAQTLEENNTLVNNSTSPMLLKDHSSCPSDGVAAANLNRSGCDMEFRPDGNDSKADEVELTPCKTTLSQGVVPGFGSPTRKTTHGTQNSLPDQSVLTADSCLLVDGESENLSILVELNNEEYQAPKVTLKRQNKRNAVKQRKILAAARLSPTADSCLLMDDHAENLSVPAELDKENQAPKITLKGRNKRKGLAGPTPDSSCLPVDGPSENLSNSAELNNEDNRAPKISPKKRNAQKAGKRRESLAGAGTVWKSGVRRSTRIRSRPLEEWRGERFLYARIHDSLATVIGLKYASPVKDGSDRTPVFKVKSFVSKKYADLVNKTALH